MAVLFYMKTKTDAYKRMSVVPSIDRSTELILTLAFVNIGFEGTSEKKFGHHRFPQQSFYDREGQ